MLIFSQTTWYPFYYMHTSAPRTAMPTLPLPRGNIKITHSMARCDDDQLTDRVYCVVVAVMHDNPVIVYCSSVGI